jgi:hypothetical protein
MVLKFQKYHINISTSQNELFGIKETLLKQPDSEEYTEILLQTDLTVQSPKGACGLGLHSKFPFRF